MSIFAVLLVCSANQCRSPAAEVVLRATLGPARSVETASAGTAVPPGGGAPIHPQTAQALRDAGFAVPDHAAQPLSRDLVEAADLVLTAERRHRAAVVGVDGSAARRTFTLLEFARVTQSLPESVRATPGSPSALVAAVAGTRAAAPATAADDLADPVALGPAAHRRLVDLLTRLIPGIAADLSA